MDVGPRPALVRRDTENGGLLRRLGVTHPLVGEPHLARGFGMLKRAVNWVIVGLIAAIFGFTGILHWTAAIAQSVCFVCIGFGVLSFLFCLFEEPSTPRAHKLRVETRPQITR